VIAPVRGAKPEITRILALAAAAALLSGCDQSALPGTRLTESVPGGDPQRGLSLIHSYGCGTCHTIPGIQGATGLVGPPLYFFSRRTMIAGMLPNTPDNVVTWLENPQAIVPNNAMPFMAIDARDATDIAAFLYTIR
jgi:cytochrome c2